MRRLGLRTKFIAASVAIIVALTLVMSVLVLYQVRRSLTAEVEKRGAALADQLGSRAEFALRTGDRESLDKIARDSLLLDDVVGVEFFAASGESLARAERPESAGVFSHTGKVMRTTSSFRDDLDFYTGTGEQATPTVAGTITVRMSLAATDRIVASIRAMILLAAAVLATIASLFAVQLARRITDPIAKLTRGVEQIGAGRLDVEIDVGEDGEIAALADHVNQMARDLKKSVDQMIQQEKMATLGRMASSITHEIGSPLNSILIDASIVRDLVPDGDGRQSAEAIIEQTRRMRETMRNLLDFARVPDSATEAVDIRQALNEAMRVLAHPLRKAGCSINITWPEQLPSVRAIKNLVVQVFVNLITNSIEASGHDGNILVEAWLDDGKVVVRLEDNGPGIADDLLEKVFDPFFTTKPEGEGTGLGLSICRQIVQGFGGTIHAEALGGAGAVFVVKLQVVR